MSPDRTATPLPEMPCRELVEVVTDYLEGALDERDRRRFDEHLAECDDCVHYLAQVRETIRLAGRVRLDGLSPEGRDALMRAFRS